MICHTSPTNDKPAAEATQQKQQVQVDPVALALLIKSTIMALQHANQTGNYSVLRDLGTPVFRERFDQARLTAIFSNLRSRGVNLTPIMVMTPNLTKPLELTPGNELHIVGNFPTQPLQVQYELLMLQVDGVWRIEGISVDAVPTQAVADASNAQQAAAAPPAQQQPEKKPAKAKNSTKAQ